MTSLFASDQGGKHGAQEVVDELRQRGRRWAAGLPKDGRRRQEGGGRTAAGTWPQTPSTASCIATASSPPVAVSSPPPAAASSAVTGFPLFGFSSAGPDSPPVPELPLLSPHSALSHTEHPIPWDPHSGCWPGPWPRGPHTPSLQAA